MVGFVAILCVCAQAQIQFFLIRWTEVNDEKSYVSIVAALPQFRHFSHIVLMSAFAQPSILICKLRRLLQI